MMCFMVVCVKIILIHVFQFCGEPIGEQQFGITQFSIHPIQFVLHTIDSEIFNEPPVLLTTHAESVPDKLLFVQLEYEDPEDDEVAFNITKDPQYGMHHIAIHCYLEGRFEKDTFLGVVSISFSIYLTYTF